MAKSMTSWRTGGGLPKALAENLAPLKEKTEPGREVTMGPINEDYVAPAMAGKEPEPSTWEQMAGAGKSAVEMIAYIPLMAGKFWKDPRGFVRDNPGDAIMLAMAGSGGAFKDVWKRHKANRLNKQDAAKLEAWLENHLPTSARVPEGISEIAPQDLLTMPESAWKRIGRPGKRSGSSLVGEESLPSERWKEAVESMRRALGQTKEAPPAKPPTTPPKPSITPLVKPKEEPAKPSKAPAPKAATPVAEKVTPKAATTELVVEEAPLGFTDDYGNLITPVPKDYTGPVLEGAYNKTKAKAKQVEPPDIKPKPEPSVSSELITGVSKSVTGLRDRVSGIRYGEPGRVLFDFDGKTYSAKEPTDILVVGIEGDAPKAWAVRQILDKTATPSRAKPTAPVAVKVAPKPTAKETWQMTADEYVSHIRGRGFLSKEISKGDIVTTTERGIPFKARVIGKTKDGDLLLNAKEFNGSTASGRFSRPVNSVERYLPSYLKETTPAVKEVLGDAVSIDKKAHKIQVQKAISEGKPVPPEVLKDYPDLAPKAAPKMPDNLSRAEQIKWAETHGMVEQAPPVEPQPGGPPTAFESGPKYRKGITTPLKPGGKLRGLTVKFLTREEADALNAKLIKSGKKPDPRAGEVEIPLPMTAAIPRSEQPVIDTPVQKVVDAIKGAKPLRAEQEKLYTAERGRRIAQSKAIGATVRGESGFKAEMAPMKGEMQKVEYDPIRGKVTQGDIDSLFNTVKDSTRLDDWEKISAREGLAKLFGEAGTNVPQQHELVLLNRVFGDEFTKAIMSKRPMWDRIKAGISAAANVPRALMASFDLSAPLRQGVFMVGRKQFYSSFAKMFRYFGSEKAYQGILEDIVQRPTYGMMKKGKLAITEMSPLLTSQEEAFMGANLAEKIPVVGRVVRASDRAYTGFLNKLRADVFDDLVGKAEKLGLDPASNTPLLQEIGKFVNAGTGRGNLPKSLAGAAPALNGILFSPRLMSSRLTLLNPAYYIKASPLVRREALKSLFTFVAAGSTVMGVAEMAGVKPSMDPFSSDFGKIKIGNTRMDVWGGFQQYIRAAAQLTAGRTTSPITGKTSNFRKGYGAMDRMDIGYRFLEQKASPVASFAVALMRGETPTGEKVDIPKEAAERFIPMIVQDMVELYKEDPSLLPLSALGVFGVGLQTYKPRKGQYGVR